VLIAVALITVGSIVPVVKVRPLSSSRRAAEPPTLLGKAGCCQASFEGGGSGQECAVSGGLGSGAHTHSSTGHRWHRPTPGSCRHRTPQGTSGDYLSSLRDTYTLPEGVFTEPNE
jgi:hypothetical protein